LPSARLKEKSTIEELREIRDRFHPPQVLLRLTSAEAKALQRLTKK
jgi:hypothetical protein